MFDISFVYGRVWTGSKPTICHLGDLEKKDYFVSREDFDLDVYLPSFGVNLQREFCWTIEQQSAFIESIVYRNFRSLPDFAVVADTSSPRKIYRVIDGKQRLTTIFNWLDNKVPVFVPGFSGTIDECPQELRRWIGRYPIEAITAYDGRKEKFEESDLDDIQMIQWFNAINFAGTPQDASHKEKLQNLLKG